MRWAWELLHPLESSRLSAQASLVTGSGLCEKLPVRQVGVGLNGTMLPS